MNPRQSTPAFFVGDRSALVVVEEESYSRQILDALGQLGYDAQLGFSTEDSIIKLRSHAYDIVVFSSVSVPGGLDADQIYLDALQIPLEQRRMQFFVMVGPNLRTADAPQAFAFSMDLVFNTADLGHLRSALKYAMTQKSEQMEHFVDCLKTMDIAFM